MRNFGKHYAVTRDQSQRALCQRKLPQRLLLTSFRSTIERRVRIALFSVIFTSAPSPARNSDAAWLSIAKSRGRRVVWGSGAYDS